jgi:hypothetical protein
LIPFSSVELKKIPFKPTSESQHCIALRSLQKIKIKSQRQSDHGAYGVRYPPPRDHLRLFPATAGPKLPDFLGTP